MIGVKLYGIEPPEMKNKNKVEKARAIAAKNYVENILKNTKKIELRNVQRGKYFRLVADGFCDGKSLTKELLQQGYGTEYYGGTKNP